VRFAGKDAVGRRVVAAELARALDVKLYRLDLSGVVSKYIGETEKNLRAVFRNAERSGAVLFFDEADPRAPSRNRRRRPIMTRAPWIVQGLLALIFMDGAAVITSSSPV
jgi:SpoVK/Ycf46/Vps4 family AAA+-type ATPase